MIAPEDVLSFWFGPLDAPDYPQNHMAKWWKKDPAFDASCREAFAEALDASGRGELAHWAETADGRQAHILLIDQLSRNMHRDTGAMYAQDDLGLELCLLSLAHGDAWGRQYREVQFFLMPLMHAEDRVIQRLSVRMFARAVASASDDDRKGAEGGLDYAERHAAIVERFGRFPHRNALLGRDSTAEEIAFLKEPGSSF